jgi:thymidylate kinase
MFITIEGTAGGGKTSQISRLKKLDQIGYHVGHHA